MVYPCPPLVPLGTGDAFCSRCHAPLERDDDDQPRSCWACRFWSVPNDIVVITYGTHYPARQRIGSSIKYAKENGEREHAPAVGGALYNYLDANWEAIRRAWEPSIVTFVPSHPDKVAKRGFDFLASVVDSQPSLRDAIGIRPMLEQVSSAEQPLQGRRPDPGAWRVDQQDGDVRGARVVVIDDMITSGATLAGISMRLRQEGAAMVFGLGIARALKRSDELLVLERLGGIPFDWHACRLRSDQ